MSNRVLYLLPIPHFFGQMNHIGGHVAHVKGVLDAFRALGYEVSILTGEASPVLSDYISSLKTLQLASHSQVARFFWGRRFVDQASRMARELRPAFVYMRYSVGFANWMPRLRKQLQGTPLVVEVNSFLSQRIPGARFLERRFVGEASRVLTVSQTNRRQMVELFGPRFEVPVSVIPNGVDIGRFPNWMDNLRRPISEDIRAGYTGMLKANYGLEVLVDGVLQARQQSPGLGLHIYGSGPHRQELIRYVASRSGVTFHEPQPFEAMPDIIGGLDILLNAACEVNAFQSPIKLYEYMASGRPIVSARTPQVESLLDVSGDRRGLTYAAGNSDELAERLIRLVRNEELVQSLAGNARKAVESRHTWVKRIESLLGDLNL